MSLRPVKARVPVRFRDQDRFDHVNHAVFLTYFEEGRVAYFREAYREPAPEWTFIIARAEVDYVAQLRVSDVAVEVELAVTRFGQTSFDFGYVVRKLTGEVVARGKTVQVWLDYATGRPVPLDPGFRERVLKLQGEVGPLGG